MIFLYLRQCSLLKKYNYTVLYPTTTFACDKLISLSNSLSMPSDIHRYLSVLLCMTSVISAYNSTYDVIFEAVLCRARSRTSMTLVVLSRWEYSMILMLV